MFDWFSIYFAVILFVYNYTGYSNDNDVISEWNPVAYNDSVNDGFRPM